MPIFPWRFSPGDVAYAKPCTPDRKVTLIKPLIHTAPNGIQCPHWLAKDTAGDEWMISQLELSSRPTTLRADGTVKLLQSVAK
jgi:hypothetical protein